MKIKVSSALALWLLAPVFGELLSSATPLNEYLSPFRILIFGMLYGSGAILVRELLIRWQKGWASLFLLGLAYGIYEEGLVVRSFFDPNWVDLGKLGSYGRVAGVSWVWAEHLSVYHALISIGASIVFVEILYYQKRRECWVGERGLAGNILAFSATLPLGAFLSPYNTPDVWLGLSWLAVIGLTVAARRVPATAKAPRRVKVPSPGCFWWTGFLATFIQIFIIYKTSENAVPVFGVTMILIVLFDLCVLGLVLRWNGDGQAWDDRHRIALINGAMTLFLVLVPLLAREKCPVTPITSPVFILGLWWISRKVNKRVMSERSRATQDSHT